MRHRPGRPHRLPKEDYVGEKTSSFDAVTWDRTAFFTHSDVVAPLVQHLERSMIKYHCVIPVYCFMPDHLHVMFKGCCEHADGLAAMSHFKLLSGKWLKRNHVGDWQGNFYDHIMRYGDDWQRHATYIAMNPVRAGLVENCFDYPFLGSIGCDLQDVVLPLD